MPPSQSSPVPESTRTWFAERLPWSVKSWGRKGLLGAGSRPFFDHAEESVVADLVREVDGGDVFYDVGAAAGFYSKWVAELAGAEVVAFEPSPGAYRSLRTALGRVSTPATGLPIALGREAGVAALEPPPPGGEGVPALADDASTGVEVKVLDGDRLVDLYNFPAPDAVKIDVEGAELDVLLGFDDVLSGGGCDVVYVEVHPPGSELHSTLGDFDATPDEVHRYLEGAGYAVTKLTEFGDHYHVKAIR